MSSRYVREHPVLGCPKLGNVVLAEEFPPLLSFFLRIDFSASLAPFTQKLILRKKIWGLEVKLNQ
jgi:hypothetical protein